MAICDEYGATLKLNDVNEEASLDIWNTTILFQRQR